MNRRVQLLVLALAAAFLVSPVGSASADPAPNIVMTTNKSVYVAADTATLTFHTTATNLNFDAVAQFPGSPTLHQFQCFAQNVNNDTFTCDLGLAYNVQIQAELTDPSNNNAVVASLTRNIPVRAEMATQGFGYHATSGRYALYARGSSPTFRSATYPALPGKRCLRHVVQRHYSSGWKNVTTTACKVEAKQGRVDWTWAHKHPSRVDFRVRATFAGDSLNQPNTSAWLYFRFK